MNVFSIPLCHARLPKSILTWNPFFCLSRSCLALVETETCLTHPPSVRGSLSSLVSVSLVRNVAHQAFTHLPKISSFPESEPLEGVTSDIAVILQYGA